MKKLLEITNQTPKERNAMLHEAFFFWAGKFTDNRTQLQLVISSKSIQNWFSKEYEKNEAEFLAIVNTTDAVTVKENELLYKRITGRVYNVYPKLFLDEIKKAHKGVEKYCSN